jgi:hypothetical protein
MVGSKPRTRLAELPNSVDGKVPYDPSREGCNAPNTAGPCSGKHYYQCLLRQVFSILDCCALAREKAQSGKQTLAQFSFGGDVAI